MRHGKVVLVAVLVLLVSSTVARAEKKAFTIADHYRVVGVSDPQVSPDGRRIVYVAGHTDLAAAKQWSELRIMAADGSGDRPLTQGQAQGHLAALVPGRRRHRVPLRPQRGRDPALPPPARRRRRPPAHDVPDGRGRPRVVPRRALHRGRLRGLPGVRRRRGVQREDLQGVERRPAARAHGGRAALPPLDVVAGRHLQPRAAGEGRGRHAHRPDAGRVRRADVQPRRRDRLRVRARLPRARGRLQPRRGPRPLHQRRPLGRADRRGRQAGAARPTSPRRTRRGTAPPRTPRTAASSPTARSASPATSPTSSGSRCTTARRRRTASSPRRSATGSTTFAGSPTASASSSRPRSRGARRCTSSTSPPAPSARCSPTRRSTPGNSSPAASPTPAARSGSRPRSTAAPSTGRSGSS